MYFLCNQCDHFMYIYLKLGNMVSNQIPTLDDITLASRNLVRNHGVIFDQD